MRLTRVDIKNFRSIQDISLRLEPSCRILVGINESGKTNILRALSLLDPEVSPSVDDVREFGPDEDPGQPASVRFVFAIDRQERIRSYEALAAKVAPADHELALLTTRGKSLTLAQVFDSRTELHYFVSLKSGARVWSFWSFDEEASIVSGWKRPKKSTPKTKTLTFGDSTVSLADVPLVHEDGLSPETLALLDDLSVSDLHAIIRKALGDALGADLPACIFWRYSEENLLPSSIEIPQFIADPRSCTPLMHMFALAGYADASTAIVEAKKRANGMRNLLKRVSESATAHMHKVWKDSEGIRLDLQQNGDRIMAAVEDKYNLYDLSRRSDGFKRFVSFLLLVSVKAKANQLTNTLYLHDEPDLSLHPSGVRFLRDELIRISKDNYVVFSTHSIFMIDREKIDRHLIVEKDNEVTTISEVDESTILDEEVLYNALGYSVFESLQAQNLVFEGWRDKRLFEIATSRIPAEHKPLKGAFAKVGVCHVKGVKDIGRITPLLELANRDCVIVSDGDKVAVEQQQQYDGYGDWVRYDQLIGEGTVSTAEDFIKPEAFAPVLNRITSENPSLPAFTIDELGESGRLEAIQRWLARGGISKERSKEILNDLKTELIGNLKPAQIEARYYDMLGQLAKRIGGKTAV